MSERTPHLEPKLGPSGSLAPQYFDQLYALDPDPWEFATNPYEAAKYDATLAALPRRRYHRVLEPGCSIGILTERLAARCEKLLATDISEIALKQARLRCANLPNVAFSKCDISTDFPNGSFDLIILSEIGYYLSEGDLEQLRHRVAVVLEPAGHLLLVHYAGETNYPLTADAVHETFRAWENRTWKGLESLRANHYRLDLFERNPAKEYRSNQAG
jgi:SAM-dependent methyltransferase